LVFYFSTKITPTDRLEDHKEPRCNILEQLEMTVKEEGPHEKKKSVRIQNSNSAMLSTIIITIKRRNAFDQNLEGLGASS
jgi:hypothetical protein